MSKNQPGDMSIFVGCDAMPCIDGQITPASSRSRPTPGRPSLCTRATSASRSGVYRYALERIGVGLFDRFVHALNSDGRHTLRVVEVESVKGESGESHWHGAGNTASAPFVPQNPRRQPPISQE